MKLLIAMLGIMLAFGAWADPAIDATQKACSIPIDRLNQNNQADINPGDNEEEEVKVLRFNGFATGICRQVTERIAPGVFTSLFGLVPGPLPYELRLTGRDTGFLCRMVDKDGGIWYTRNWASLFRIDLSGGNFYVTQRLVCRRATQRPQH